VTGIDPETAFDAARDRLVELVDKWNDLPHSVATQVWKLVEEHAGIDGDVEQEVKKPATHAHLKRPD
jgi:hypothetical protein